jgi:hypothetical protein
MIGSSSAAYFSGQPRNPLLPARNKYKCINQTNIPLKNIVNGESFFVKVNSVRTKNEDTRAIRAERRGICEHPFRILFQIDARQYPLDLHSGGFRFFSIFFFKSLTSLTVSSEYV